MKAEIYSHTHLISTVEIIPGDISMGGIYGLFSPTMAFDTYIKPKFKKHWLTSILGLKPSSTLELNVQLENGYFIFAEGGITIEQDENNLLRIDMAGVDTDVIHNFLLTEPPLLFVEDPWETISIQQKIAFEEELYKELGTNGSFKSKHPLQGFELKALCKHGGSDDVLFTSRHRDSENQFAVIHLTWRGDVEAIGYPKVKFYKDFESFKNLRMQSDKQE